MKRLVGTAAAATMLATTAAHAQETMKIDPADTGFMIIATGLVLLMTLPGLALFYCGMVRKKNVLATMAQSAAATAIVSILWFAAGYSLTFAGEGSIFGSFDRIFFAGIGLESINPAAKTIP